MDFYENRPHLSTGIKTFAGLNSGLLSMVASGADGFEAAHAFHEGKTADGVADATKAGAGVVGGLANAYHAATEGYKNLGASEEGKEALERQVKMSGRIGNAAGAIGDGVNG